MSLKKSMIGVMIRIYRRTPLYPAWGGRLAAVLARFNRLTAGSTFVHDTGRFRLHIDLDQIIDSQIYYAGTFEPNTVATIEHLLKPGSVAIDVGANIGYLTMVMADRVGAGGRVVAFEPTPWAYARLADNLGLNDMPQVKPVRMAGPSHQKTAFRSSSR